MGCSSSREARGGVVSPAPAPAERRQGLRSSSLTMRAASALTSLGICRGGHDGVQPYTPLPSEEAVMKVASDPAEAEEALPGEGAAAEEERGHGAPSTPATAMASVEDAASATSSWTARWSAEPAPPSLPPALDLDLAILPGFGQRVEVPSPSHPALLYPEQENPPPPPPPPPLQEATDTDMGTPAARDIPEVTGFVRARVDEFHSKIAKKKAADEDPVFIGGGDDVTAAPWLRLPRSGKPVVLYFTSLRSVRRTFEDCRAVRAILRCYRVRLDERDVSMHAAFKSELRDLLGAGGAGLEGRALPRVFLGGRHDLGGAEDVRALHEAGELARALAGCDAAPAAAAGRPGHVVGACAACGEARFVPCGTCHGSRKVFVGDEGCRFAGCFRRCPDCNENGLIRCPVCCY